MTESDNHSCKCSDLTDQTLMRRFKGGEQDAASALYVRYAKRLQKLASRQTSTDLSFRIASDEIVQSVFRTFFRRVAKGQYDAVDGDDLWRLFLVIALNKIRSSAEFHRAQKRDMRKTKTADPRLFEALGNSSQDDQTEFTVLRITIDEVLSELPDDHAQMVRLRIEGHTLPEIAEITGRAQRTTERVLKGFREALIMIIED